MSWDNVEDAFKELDKKEYASIARTLHSYFVALKTEGFSAREAFRLTEAYSKFIYDMCFEEFLRQKEKEDEDEWLDNEDVDLDEEDE